MQTKTVIKKNELHEAIRPITVRLPLLDEIVDLDSSLEESKSNGKSSSLYDAMHPSEVQKILNQAKEEAQESSAKIIQEAEEEALKIKANAENELTEAKQERALLVDEKRREAEKEFDSIVQEAQSQKESLIAEAEKSVNLIKKNAHNEGLQEGLEQGYIKGEEETKRLIEVLHKASSSLIQEREKVLLETESELVDLVLLIANKVVKSITENYKRVVYDNVVAALEKLRIRSEVIIRVHPDDLYTVTRYKKQILSEVNDIENMKILEDPTVDKGGCIVTSEFGAVDARISAQLAEIEEQIRRISPIKDK